MNDGSIYLDKYSAKIFFNIPNLRLSDKIGKFCNFKNHLCSSCRMSRFILGPFLVCALISDRESAAVYVYDVETTDWTKQEHKLPHELFSHGCNFVSLPDERRGILTAGGFKTEGIPAVSENAESNVH